jgi:transposase
MRWLLMDCLVRNTRMRLECVRLAGQGRTVAEIASILEVHPVTVRGALHRFEAGGTAAMTDAARSGRPPKVNRADLEAVEELLDESAEVGGPSWTLPGLAAWLAAESGVIVHSSRLSVLLRNGTGSGTNAPAPACGTRPAKPSSRSPGISWRACGCAAVRLRAEAGELDLYFLDEAGFAPTLPTGYTWARRGTRAMVFHEGTSGRRVNALGALCADGDQPALVFRTITGKVTSDLLLDFIGTQVAGLTGVLDTAAVPSKNPRHRPCTIVLDNASTHVSRRMKDARPVLEGLGITLFCLPPYSPELNKIERVWRSVIYEDIPIRAYPWIEELQAAVDQALTQRDALLRTAAPDLRKTA